MAAGRAAVPSGKKAEAHAPPPPDVVDLMLRDLARSGLGEDEALAMRVRPANGELRQLGLPEAKAYVIPYLGPDGEETGFCRWRYLEDTRKGLLGKTDAKPIRYVQAPGTMPGVYLPPLADWPALMADPKQPLVVTEGEKKAAAATLAGHPCIGLGGVYSYRSNSRGVPWLETLKGFEWAGRVVFVAYDSDSHQNTMVVAARNALCRELLACGAEPRVVELSHGPSGEKRGIDDLVVAEGPGALSEALEAARPYSAAQQLFDLSEVVAYVRNPGAVVEIETGLKMRPAADFVGHAYSNRHYWEQVFDAKGNAKMVKRSAAKAWLDWEHRHELASFVYEPGREKIFEGEDGLRRYNTWPGWGVEPLPEGETPDVGPWTRLLERLFFQAIESRQWFERWCAMPLQRPGLKMYTCAVIWGVETGTGKTLVGETLGKIYGSNYTSIGDRELNDFRNEWAMNKQFAMGDDVTGHDHRRNADRLKAMITQAKMRIDPKYIPSYEVRDVLNYYFTSNHPDAFFIDDADRRYFVHEVVCEPMPRSEVAEFRDWLHKHDGASHLFRHLLDLRLGDMEHSDRAPDTLARAAMVDDGRSALSRWVAEIRLNPEQALSIGKAPLSGDLWSAEDLLMLYDPERASRTTATAVSREMKKHGFRLVFGGQQVRLSSGKQVRLFAARNLKAWEDCRKSKVLADHYESTRCRTGKK